MITEAFFFCCVLDMRLGPCENCAMSSSGKSKEFSVKQTQEYYLVITAMK